jgi:hypothetical protein
MPKTGQAQSTTSRGQEAPWQGAPATEGRPQGWRLGQTDGRGVAHHAGVWRGLWQSHNAQAGVDIDTMMVIATHVTQACNDKREVVPTLEQIAALPDVLGKVQTLIADNGFCSQVNVQACVQAGIEPLLAIKRESHHEALMARFAPDPDALQTTDPLANMVHKLSTQAGKALYKLRKQTVEPVFGIIKHVMGWRQVSMRELDKAQGEWNLVTMAWNIKRMHVLCAA